MASALPFFYRRKRRERRGIGCWLLVLGAWCLVLGAWCLNILWVLCVLWLRKDRVFSRAGVLRSRGCFFTGGKGGNGGGIGCWFLVPCALCFVLCALCLVVFGLVSNV